MDASIAESAGGSIVSKHETKCAAYPDRCTTALATTVLATGPSTFATSTRHHEKATSYSWKITPTGTTEGFRGLAAVSHRVAWASGEDWDRSSARPTAGKTWSDVSFDATNAEGGPLQLRDIEAWDTNHAVTLVHRPRRRLADLLHVQRRQDVEGALPQHRSRTPSTTAWRSPQRAGARDERPGRRLLPDRADQRLRPHLVGPVQRRYAACPRRRVRLRRERHLPGVWPVPQLLVRHRWRRDPADLPFHTTADAAGRWRTCPCVAGRRAGIYSVDFRAAGKGVPVGGDFDAETDGSDASAYLSYPSRARVAAEPEPGARLPLRRRVHSRARPTPRSRSARPAATSAADGGRVLDELRRRSLRRHLSAPPMARAGHLAPTGRIAKLVRAPLTSPRNWSGPGVGGGAVRGGSGWSLRLVWGRASRPRRASGAGRRRCRRRWCGVARRLSVQVATSALRSVSQRRAVGIIAGMPRGVQEELVLGDDA